MKPTIKFPWTAKLIKAITKLLHRLRAKTILLRFGYGQRKKEKKITYFTRTCKINIHLYEILNG